ncbi:MAG: cytochrome c biogenesis protein CcsA [Muribaculaceae bacterium]
MIKIVIYFIYSALLLAMAAATIVEKCCGTALAHENIYGSHWFVGCWMLLAVLGIAYLVQRRVHRRFAVMVLHASFVVILAGAFVSHISAERGTVHLRMGEPQNSFTDHDNAIHSLPFALQLIDFATVYYLGTEAPLDYRSVISADGDCRATVSMNNVATIGGYRFYQSSYDDDGAGVVLGVSHDAWGIAITYIGYALLLIAIIMMLFSRYTAIRTLYKKATKPLIIIALMCAGTKANAQAPQVVSADMAQAFGKVGVLWADRICPVETVAADFVTKLTGRSSWHGYSACQVFCSWMIYYSSWEQQRIIRIKDSRVQRLLGIDDQWARYADFWSSNNDYKLAQALADARAHGADESYKKALREADEKVNIVSMFYGGAMLKMFPIADSEGKMGWYSPGDVRLPDEISSKEFYFVKHVGDFLVEAMLAGNQNRAEQLMAKIRAYQREKLGDALPSRAAIEVECALCKAQSARWIVFLMLFVALAMCLIDACAMRLCGNRAYKLLSRGIVWVYAIYLTALIGARWYVAHHIPLSNGYETMVFMSWAIIVVSLLVMRRFAYMLSLGMLASALCMLVAMMAGGNPQITPLMPVLQSPLLSLHVLTVMSAYSIFALQVLIAIRVLVQLRSGRVAEAEKSTALSRFLLYPAVGLLAVGIFIGAVWANVSWGNYWSWDPKETWALITMMIYAIPFHGESLPFVRSARAYNIYVASAFLAVLITYFGVNYFLTGMHSYAG